jgi:hypothetical protein
MIDNFRAGYSSVHSGWISQVPEENFDVAIVHELHGRLPSNEDANAIPFCQKSSHQISSDKARRAGHQDLGAADIQELGLKFDLGIGFLGYGLVQ